MVKKKKQTNALALASVEDLVKTDLGITNDDVVAVAVAGREESLKADAKIAIERGREISKLITDLTDERKQLVQTLAESKHYPAVARAESALQACGFEDVTTKVTGNYTPSTRDVSVRLAINVRRRGGYGGTSLERTSSIKSSAAITNVSKRLATLEKKQEQVTTRLAAIRAEQSNLASLERRARAELACRTLSKSTGGKEVLGALKGIKFDELPALPSV
jgi:hypothetical protein